MASKHPIMTLREQTMAFLFSRWLAICYADEHMDNEGNSQHDINFNSSDYMSLLNRAKGDWYKEQLLHFEKVVLPNYIKNGTYISTEEFLKFK